MIDYGIQNIGGQFYLVVEDYHLKKVFNEIEQENETEKNEIKDLLQQQKTECS